MTILGHEKQAVSIKISKFCKGTQSESPPTPQWPASLWISLRLSSIFSQCTLTYVIPLFVLRLTPHPIRNPLRKTEQILSKCLKSPSKITLSLVLDALISLKGKPSGEGEEGRRGGQRAHTVTHITRK